MRWERHWWQKTGTVEIVRATEPTVWVDPELYVDVEGPPPRRAQGTIPPPVYVGPFCSLDAPQDDWPTVVTGELDADDVPTVVTEELVALL